MPKPKTNILYYADNLDIIRRYIPDNSIDLAYLEPPFNAKATYNDLFEGTQADSNDSQIKSFYDTWHWTTQVDTIFKEICLTAPPKVSNVMQGLFTFLNNSDMKAYLTMTYIRLLELKRVLKETGSIYLLCDTQASHYLKIIMDAIFGGENFKNELIWIYPRWTSVQTKFRRMHDTIFFYTKSADSVFNWTEAEIPQTEQTMLELLWDTNIDTGHNGKYNNIVDSQNKLVEAIKRRGLDLSEGNYRVKRRKALITPSDIWIGYPFQTLEKIYERIIRVSSNENDIILDPFCGTGTFLSVAHMLKRKWIGIDITHLAITITKSRLKQIFPGIQYKIIGEPINPTELEAVAEQDRQQLQQFALSFISDLAYNNECVKEEHINNNCYNFVREFRGVIKAVIQVNIGKSSVNWLRRLNLVRQKERAEIGILLTLEHPTRLMEEDAIRQGYYISAKGQLYPRLQILTINDCLNGKRPKLPPWANLIPVS